MPLKEEAGQREKRNDLSLPVSMEEVTTAVKSHGNVTICFSAFGGPVWVSRDQMRAYFVLLPILNEESLSYKQLK